VAPSWTGHLAGSPFGRAGWHDTGGPRSRVSHVRSGWTGGDRDPAAPCSRYPPSICERAATSPFLADRRSIGRPCVPAGTARRGGGTVEEAPAPAVGPSGGSLTIGGRRTMDVSLGGAGGCLAGTTQRSRRSCIAALPRLHQGISRMRRRLPRSSAQLAAELGPSLVTIDGGGASVERRRRRRAGRAADIATAGAVIARTVVSGVGAWLV
jgi:hypothetical protein